MVWRIALENKDFCVVTESFPARVGPGGAEAERCSVSTLPTPMKSLSHNFVVPSIISLLAGSSFGAIIAQQDFEGSPATPILTYTTTGTVALNSGAVAGTFAPSSSTWGASGQGLSFTGNSGTVTFASLNTVGLTDVDLTLRLGGLSINSTGNGMDNADNFIVSISPDNGVTFYEQVRVNGNTNARWSFSNSTGSAARAYATSAVTVFAPAGGGERTTDGYSYLSVTDLPAVSNLIIRLAATDNDTNERWLVDSVVVTAIPEPRAALLGGLGIIALLRRRRF